MSQTPISSDIYYKNCYWNDHPLTLAYLARLISSEHLGEHHWWIQHLCDHYIKGVPRRRALILNCGNGWVERELAAKGVFESADAFDYSHELLTIAKAEGAHLPIRYFQADCNKIELGRDAYDLVINVAAMHHVQLVDRLHRQIAVSLEANGLFVNFDYVGPHRNQYGEKHFQLMSQVNATLPHWFQAKPFVHPHLPTMMATDPTEAIHSELIFNMFERYFTPIERKDLHGGIAYQIMYNNHWLYRPDMNGADECVRWLLEVDELYGTVGNLPPLFSFFIGLPRKSMLNNSVLLEQYAREETEREARAEGRGGYYY